MKNFWDNWVLTTVKFEREKIVFQSPDEFVLSLRMEKVISLLGPELSASEADNFKITVPVGTASEVATL